MIRVDLHQLQNTHSHLELHDIRQFMPSVCNNQNIWREK